MSVGLLSFAAPPSGFSGGRSQFNTTVQGELAFMNLMKGSAGWQNIDPVVYDLNADGYPGNVTAGSLTALQRIPTDAERSWALRPGGSGAYTIDWLGAGTVGLTGLTLVSGSLTSVGAGRNTVTVTPTTNTPSISITAVGSPRITDIRFYYTDDAADIAAGKVLSKRFKEIVQQAKFGVFRYLNWGGNAQGGCNFANTTTWDSRRPSTHAFWIADEYRASIYKGATTSSVSAGATTYAINDGGGAPTHGQTITVKWDANIQVATFSGSIVGNVLTVSGAAGNTIVVGMNLTGGSVTAGTYITKLGTGVGGNGTYILNKSATGSPTAATYFSNYLNYNGNTAIILSPRAVVPSDGAANTGVPDSGRYYTLVFDSQLNGWLAYGTRGAVSIYLNNGMPPEIFLQACIEVGCHPSIPVPGLAADPLLMGNASTSWIRGFAALFRSTFPAWGKMFIEGWNEGWNNVMYVTPWSNKRQYVRMGGEQPGQPEVTPTLVTSVTSYTPGGSATFAVTGTLPAVGALLSSGTAPTGLNFNTSSTGYVTASGGGSITVDVAPSSGSFAGSSATTTIALASTCTVTTPTSVPVGMALKLTTTGSLPASIPADGVVYALTSGTNPQVSATPGGLAIDTSADSQSGTQTVTLVLVFRISQAAQSDFYGLMMSCMGQAIASDFGFTQGQVASQTRYNMICGVNSSSMSSLSVAQASSGARLSSRSYVLNNVAVSPFIVSAASNWTTHISPANYIDAAATGATTQYNTLSGQFAGRQFVASISAGIMTVASISGGLTLSAGSIIFGELGIPLSAGITILPFGTGGTSGTGSTGTYAISDNSVSAAAGSTIYAGSGLTPLHDYIASFQGSAFNGQVAGTVLTVNTPPTGSPVYVGMSLFSPSITLATAISSLGTGTGGTGTYNLNRNYSGGISAEDMTANSLFDIPGITTIASVAKQLAQAYGVQKMTNYEGGFNANRTDVLLYAVKNLLSSPVYAEGMKTLTLNTYAIFDALTDGTFTFEYPSLFQLDGRYPSDNIWSVNETIFQAPAPPQMAAAIQYNN